MNNGIKPTRLYRLTGKKHLQKILGDKQKAWNLVDRGRMARLQLMGIIFGSVLGLSYSFGKFSEPGKPKGGDNASLEVCTEPKRDFTKGGPCPDDYHKPIPRCPPSNCSQNEDGPRVPCTACNCPCKKKMGLCSSN